MQALQHPPSPKMRFNADKLRRIVRRRLSPSYRYSHAGGHPLWLKKRISLNTNFDFTKNILKKFNVNTICQSARCPNIFDCFSRKAATFLILGNVCTRNCRFCFVEKGQPKAPDGEEADRIVDSIARLGLRHVVITSVTRDDLPDGGSTQFVRIVEAIRQRFGKGVNIEVLVPDFKGNRADIKRIIEAAPDIFSHNIETAPRLYKRMRPEADYKRSINVLKFAKETAPALITKSAVMLGLGETEEEVVSVMKELRGVNCDMLAIGQYLRPSSRQVGIEDFINPKKFLRFKKIAYSLGFKDVQSNPFVRSSYKEEIL